MLFWKENCLSCQDYMVQEPQVTINPSFKGERQEPGPMTCREKGRGREHFWNKEKPNPHLRCLSLRSIFFLLLIKRHSFPTIAYLSVNVVYVLYFNPCNNPTWALPAFCIKGRSPCYVGSHHPSKNLPPLVTVVPNSFFSSFLSIILF